MKNKSKKQIVSKCPYNYSSKQCVVKEYDKDGECKYGNGEICKLETDFETDYEEELEE